MRAEDFITKHTDQGVAESSLGTILKWPEVVNKVNSAMKAMGWKGQRKDDGSFMFSTRGRLPEESDEWYIVIIDNRGNNMFTYALGTVEEGDPYIGEQETLPNTEASVSELMKAIREGFGLNESYDVSESNVNEIITESYQLDEGLGDWIEQKMDDLLNTYNNHNYDNRPDAVASAVRAAPADLPDDVAERLIDEFLKKKEHAAALEQAARAQGTTADKIRPYLKYFVGNFVERWRRIPARAKRDFWKDLALGVFRLIVFILQAMAKGKR